MQNLEAIVQEVFRSVFDQEALVISRETTAQDVEGWDSLSNIQMIVAVEKKFGVKFKAFEISSFKNVGDLFDALKSKLSA